jgi:uncharacterized protein YkwD
MTARCLLVVAFLVVVGPAHADEKPAEPKAPALSKAEKQLLELFNAERKKNDLPPLEADVKLMRIARGHSENMAKSGKFDHTLDDKAPMDRAKDIGYQGFVGENIAWGAGTPAEAMKVWMNSKPHRENILNGRYAHLGLGRAVSADGRAYWTAVFGVPFPKRQP